MKKEVNKSVVCLIVDNQPNVLARISSLIGRRNFNISTITASETNTHGLTRITLVVNSDDENVLNQVVAQTEKLEVVKKAYLLDMSNTLYRELLLIKIKTDEHERSAIREIVDIYRAKIIDLSKSSMIIELTGSPEKIDGFMDMVDCYEIMEVCRTGVTGIERGL
ncbi:MAG: acetolactate synthase small subunit [Clostridiales bacterium]|nr:acetolactate synthase small subunit [Clostridiales bacterium]